MERENSEIVFCSTMTWLITLQDFSALICHQSSKSYSPIQLPASKLDSLKVCNNGLLLIIKLCWTLPIILVIFKIVCCFRSWICFHHRACAEGGGWNPTQFGPFERESQSLGPVIKICLTGQTEKDPCILTPDNKSRSSF
jgi:hypothetical protein